MNRKDIKWIIYGSSVGIIIVFIILLAVYNIGDGWLGFWGGVIGSGLGVVGAFLVLNKQIKQDKIESKKSKIDNTFFNLLDMFTQLKERRVNEELFINYYADLQKYAVAQIKEIGTKKVLNNPDVVGNLKDLYLLYIEEIKVRLENQNIDVSKVPDNLDQKLGYLIDEFSKFFPHKTNDELKEFHFISVDLTNAAVQLPPLIERIKSEHYNSNYSYSLISELKSIYTTAENLNIGDVIREQLQPLIIEISKYENANDFSLISSNEDKEIIVTKVSDIYYSRLVSYFKLTHRIIKYINDNVEDSTEKNEYIGFFRSTMDETEMLVIFYNSFFSEKGKGLGHQLSKIPFFGKPGELGENDGFVQHFNRQKLLWPEEDLEIMRSYE